MARLLDDQFHNRHHGDLNSNFRARFAVDDLSTDNAAPVAAPTATLASALFARPVHVAAPVTTDSAPVIAAAPAPIFESAPVAEPATTPAPVADTALVAGGIAPANGEHPNPLIGGSATSAGIVALDLVSTSGTGVSGDGDSGIHAAIFSPNETRIAFDSAADNLTPGFSSAGEPQVFVKTLAGGAVAAASVSSAGVVSDASSVLGGFSANSNVLGFTTAGDNLVSGDTNGVSDVFVHNLATGVTTLVSDALDGTQANGASTFGSFSSSAPAGTLVAFTSAASNLVDGDTNGGSDLFIKDLTNGQVSRVSTDSAGNQTDATVTTGGWFSPNHNYLAFSSNADNLITDGTGTTDQQLYVKDLSFGTVYRISSTELGDGTHGPSVGADASSTFDGFTPDSNFAMFSSAADNLVAGDTNGTSDIFLKAVQSGVVTLLSTNAQGVEGNGDSTDAHFSGDGSKIVFTSTSTNLVANDTDGVADIFEKDLGTGTVTLISKAVDGTPANGVSHESGISADGSDIVYDSAASNLVTGDSNASGDTFVARLGYTVDAFPVTLAAGLTVGTLRGTAVGATVTISAGFETGDTLSAATAGTNITAAYNAATHVMTLTGNDTSAHYQDVMRSITFANTTNDDAAAAPTRTISWQVDDGFANNNLSNVATTVINVVHAPAAPPPPGTTDTLDAQGSLAAQTIVTDSGATWHNTFDTTGTQPWTTMTSSFDATGHQLTQLVNNDDGTHTLTLFDAANAFAFTSATIAYDANWMTTGISGTNDDGSHTVSTGEVDSALDTSLWFTAPFDPNQGQPTPIVFTGGANADFLYGGTGADTLNGAGGNDLLAGGHGNDTLTGGAGDDRFVFHNGDGQDTVTDFAPGDAAGDVIDLHNYDATDFASLQPFMTQVGADTVIAFDAQNTITLHNVTMTQLNAGDFIFS